MRGRADFIVGIDPDREKSGVALLDTASLKFLSLQTLPFPELLEFLMYQRDYTDRVSKKSLCVVVEAGWLNLKSNFHGYYGNRGEKIAKDVGANHETGKKIIEMCRHWGIEVVEKRPLSLQFHGFNLWKGKDGKITHEEFVELTGWTKQTNQEKRDAALLAWDHAKIPTKINRRR